jgi:uncharacterized protein
MRPVRALGIYILFVFIGGALLAPLLYWSVQSLGQSFSNLARIPFHRFLNRAFLLLALLGLWPLFRALGAKSLKDVGLVSPRGQWKNLGIGFGLGFFSLAVIGSIALGVGASAFAAKMHNIPEKIAGAALTAVVVGTLEEILFRGGIFGAFRRNLNWFVALVLSSSIYALVHFLGKPSQDGPVAWHSGLELLPHMLEGFFHWRQLFPGFLNLTVIGGILALAYFRTGNLYFSIGLHTGWIFCLKCYGASVKHVPEANAWIWGGTKMIDGWLALFILSATLLCMLYLIAPHRKTQYKPLPKNSPE